MIPYRSIHFERMVTGDSTYFLCPANRCSKLPYKCSHKMKRSNEAIVIVLVLSTANAHGRYLPQPHNTYSADSLAQQRRMHRALSCALSD